MKDLNCIISRAVCACLWYCYVLFTQESHGLSAGIIALIRSHGFPRAVGLTVFGVFVLCAYRSVLGTSHASFAFCVLLIPLWYTGLLKIWNSRTFVFT